MSDELTLVPPGDRPKRGKKKAIEDVSATVRVEAFYLSEFEQRYRFAMPHYMYKAARDRKILKDLIADMGEPMTMALIHDFFVTFANDPHVRWRNASGTVRNFKSCIDRLVMLRNGHHVDDRDDRTRRNDDEIDRATRPRT